MPTIRLLAAILVLSTTLVAGCTLDAPGASTAPPESAHAEGAETAPTTASATSPEAATPSERLRAAIDAMDDLTTLRADVTIQSETSTTLVQSQIGRDPDVLYHRMTQSSEEMSLEDLTPDSEMLMRGGQLLLRYPPGTFSSWRPELTANTWLEVSPADRPKFYFADHVLNQPLMALMLCRDSLIDVEALGTDVVEGRELAHYRAGVDHGRLLDEIDFSTLETQPEEMDLATAGVPTEIDYWVGSDGRVYRNAWSVESGLVPGSYTTVFHSFEQPLQLPETNEVQPLKKNGSSATY